MTHINDFNRACNLIFEMLYDSFPVPIHINQRDIGFYEASDPANKPREVLSATFSFLADEGFISYDRSTDKQAIKQSVRLTSKGLSKLQRIPGGIEDNRKTVIELLKGTGASIGKQASSITVNKAMQLALTSVFS